VNVEVLYFDGCPSHEALLPRLRELMAQAGVAAPVQLTHIESVAAAERERFLGSPTLRINGEDVDPTASERTDFGLKCRLYPSAEGLRGTVPDELVLAALTRPDEPRDAAQAAAGVPPADFDAFARVLQLTFPVREDAALALTLVRLLSAGYPVSPAALAQVVDRPEREVTERLDDWPNVERDQRRRVVGFSGLTLRATGHSFRVGDRQLYAWCAWDMLFLPSLLDETARVRSTCAVTGADVELVVSPRGVQSNSPGELYVTFPALAGLDTGDIRRSCCCHVVFLAGAEAARRWEATHAGSMVLGVDAAYELGRRTVAPLLEPASRPVSELSR
jgi:alkylmercury lyase